MRFSGRGRAMLLAGSSVAAPGSLQVRCVVRARREKVATVPKRREEAETVASGEPRRGFGASVRKCDAKWQCVSGCGACCKLDKGPAFPSPEEIFSDDPTNLQLYKSLVGPDGWCIHYEHAGRTCSIYQERPYFCRVEPDVFEKLYGIGQRRFNREACSSCRDTITAVYGSSSEELKNFDHSIRNNK